MKTKLLFVILVSALFLNGCSSEKKEKANEASYTEEVYDISGVERDVYGTLMTPNIDEKYPLVIIVGGSGPTDRDGNIYNQTMLKDIANGLIKENIATYRFDKSTFSYSDDIEFLTSLTPKTEYTDDVEAIVNEFASDENISNIYILGHSQGGIMIPDINQVVGDKVNGYIMMATPTTPFADLFLQQIEYINNIDGVVDEQEQNYYEYIKNEVDTINDPTITDESIFVLNGTLEYWRYENMNNNFELADELTQEVLVLQGTRDYNVVVAEFENWQNKYGDKANWQFKLYDNLNHFMIYGEGEGLSTPEEVVNSEYTPVDENVINDIIDWVKAIEQ